LSKNLSLYFKKSVYFYFLISIQYTATDDGKCQLNSNKTEPVISKVYKLTTEDDIKKVVANVGPVSIGIFVTDNFFSYSSGVFSDQNCAQSPNHAVLIVGYGTDNGQDYWLIKNSWGQDWGESGYIRVLRNVNMCNVLDDPEFGI
jgi:C1A family cysteine protease